MKFGTKVLVQRGSNHHAKNLRVVTGKLIGAQGNQVHVRLDYYDSPYDTDYDKEHGMWFGASVVVPLGKPLYILS